jgi:hypothetical protein
VPSQPRLIIQVPRGGSVQRGLDAGSSPLASGDQVVVEAAPIDEAGNLDPPAEGEVVMSVLSPEALAREPAEVRRVIGGAGTSTEPLVILVEAAEELRDEELAAVLDASAHTKRAVILRVLRNV